MEHRQFPRSVREERIKFENSPGYRGGLTRSDSRLRFLSGTFWAVMLPI